MNASGTASTVPEGLTSSTSPSATQDLASYWKDDFVPLQKAGQEVLKVLRKDESSPHGDLYRRILSTAPASGPADTEPLNHGYSFDGHWSHVQSIPLPSHLRDQLSKAKVSTMMGIFAEADMAWLSVDDTVYLWAYGTPNEISAGSTETEFLYFKVPSGQPIISVGLAPPKRGVFTEVVKWCLVVTTKEEAMLCALATKDQKGLGIIRTKFVIPSDWISFLSVATTKDGRVFLGGQDGNLYELDYSKLHTSSFAKDDANGMQVALDNFYDSPDNLQHASRATATSDTTTASTGLISRGKRALENILIPNGQPAHKCRKLNHSQPRITEFVPTIFSKVADVVFGDGATTGGGPIIQMAVDDERQTIYTLSTRGWICVLDIADSSNVALSSVLNTSTTAHLYLDGVSRGRMYAPATSSPKEGLLSFPGGGEAAQAGVGGMEGARRILKISEQERKQSRRKSHATSLLTPVSINVVPSHASSRITLVAVSAGGLRYYLSSLSPSVLGAGPVTPPFGTPRQRHPWRPHSRMTLCHVRAPPSLTNANPAIPTVPAEHRVDAACYSSGTFFSAFKERQSAVGQPGNILVIASANCEGTLAKKKESEEQERLSVVPGGVYESVSFPMELNETKTLPGKVLPGGRVWDVRASSFAIDDKLLALNLYSRTPSDTELGFGMVPAYVPPKVKPLQAMKAGVSSQALASQIQSKQSLSSLAITILTNLLLSRPARHGIDVRRTVSQDQTGFNVYRISARFGFDGFSHSAADYKSNTVTSGTRSARLRPWLLTPDPVPLNPLSLQHLERSHPQFLALNAGGIHVFQSTSMLQQLSTAILKAGDNAPTDPVVTRLFQGFGYGEGCALCLLLATKRSSGADLRTFAIRAALSRAYRPSLVSTKASNEQQNTEDPWVPKGFKFTASALHEGLTLAIARLLRPVWFKPAVVVTEGRMFRKRQKLRASPAKVELLLDDRVLDEIRGPLCEMQKLMGTLFFKAVSSVPLGKPAGGTVDSMEVDDDNFFLTRALEYQQKTHGQSSSFVFRASEANEFAQNIEERNIHSLYRLVSRTTQFLSLFSHLRRAHSMPDLPEVEWGQLHGISISRLVMSREGQERIDITLNALVTASASASAPQNISADARELASLLSEQCFHFFSQGSRHAYMGFSLAQDALSIPSSQRARCVARTREAVNSFKKAALSWVNPSLISGRLLQTVQLESPEDVANRAMVCDSPLAKACAFLMELSDAAAVVDLCLLTASNFTSSKTSFGRGNSLGVVSNSRGQYSWESDLYHTRPEIFEDLSQARNSIALGTSVTAQDAVNTCFALVFYHLTQCLNNQVDSPTYLLGEKMVSVCAAYQDTTFLYKLFEHLMSRNFADVLLRIDSEALARWLIEEKEGRYDLLFKYYQVQEQPAKAGDVALNQASDPGSYLSLNERIECLVNAVDSFHKAVQTNQDVEQSQQKLKHSNEKLNIGRLQMHVLKAISSTKYDVSPDDLKPLSTTLMSANDLLNKFAIPFDMYDSCILLLHICNYNDVIHIHKFWKSLLCEEVFPCKTRNEATCGALRSFAEGSMVETPTVELQHEESSSKDAFFESGVWMDGVQRIVSRLGKEMLVSGDEPVFPIDFIVSCLEELRCIYASTASSSDKEETRAWTFSVLIGAGIGHISALNSFEELIEAENHSSMGVDAARRLEQIRTMTKMMEDFVGEAMAIRNRDVSSAKEELSKAYESGYLLSLLEDYMSKLKSLPGDTTLDQSRLLSIEEAIRRFFD